MSQQPAAAPRWESLHTEKEHKKCLLANQYIWIYGYPASHQHINIIQPRRVMFSRSVVAFVVDVRAIHIFMYVERI